MLENENVGPGHRSVEAVVRRYPSGCGFRHAVIMATMETTAMSTDNRPIAPTLELGHPGLVLPPIYDLKEDSHAPIHFI
jgi:cobalamin biosynthesis protein CobD/CbiB